jgi:hypothetical protein
MLLVVGVVGTREQSRLVCSPTRRIAFNLEAAAVRGQSGIVGVTGAARLARLPREARQSERWRRVDDDEKGAEQQSCCPGDKGSTAPRAADRPPNIVGHPLVAVHSRTSVRQLSHDLFGGISTIEEKSKAAKPLQVNRHFCSEPMSFSNSLANKTLAETMTKKTPRFVGICRSESKQARLIEALFDSLFIA